MVAERNSAVSMAKGLAIIMMVLAHAILSGYSWKFINMFHMPVFFFASGYCFKESYLSDLKMFVLKRIKGLYVPYIKYSLFFLACHNLFFHFNIYSDMYGGWAGGVSHVYGINEFFVRAVHIVTRMFDHEQLLGGYWFLHALLCASLLAYFCIRFLKKNIISIAALLFMSFLTSYLNFHIPIVGIGTKEFVAALIFLVAYLVKKNKLIERVGYWLVPVSVFVVAVGTFLWQMDFLHIHYIKLVPWLLSALLGVMGCFKLCYLIGRFRPVSIFLSYVGDNTLPILTWHFLCFKVMSLYIVLHYDLPIQRLAEFPVVLEYNNIYWIGYLVVGVALPLVINFALGGLRKKISFKKRIYEKKGT